MRDCIPDVIESLVRPDGRLRQDLRRVTSVEFLLVDLPREHVADLGRKYGRLAHTNAERFGEPQRDAVMLLEMVLLKALAAVRQRRL